jgi:predicted phosphodiesterase
MRTAILSDIHSNVFALEAVLRDADRRGVDRIVDLGDSLYGPIAPRATFDLMNARAVVTIRGNQDRLIDEATPKEAHANATLMFVLDDLGEGPRSWIRSLPFDRQLEGDIYLCHGTPANDAEYLLEDVNAGWPKLRTDAEIMRLLNGQASKLMLCGHTHIPRTVMLASGQMIVNPGTVGLPAYTDDEPVHHSMENYAPHAAYAIVEDSGAGWTVMQIKVAYDHRAAATAARKRQREDWAHFLTTGRGL